MRPIKYKAWHKTNKVIYDVSGLAFYNKLCEVFDPEVNDRIRILGFPLEDVILLQYTGLKDKNGREIYEGDIIEFFHDENTADTAERSPVEWFGREKWNYPAFDLHDFYILDHHFEGNALSEIISTGNYHYEIIGNIYEDKHLLEVQT